MTGKNFLKEKISEAVASVLPITLIVAIMCFFFVPVENGLMLAFVIGSIMIIFGMALFTLGSDMSMTQIGNHIGVKMTKSRKVWLILILSLFLGAIITIAEPDLQVLASNVPGIDSGVLIITVSAGVGFFLMLAMLRILLSIRLKWLLIFFYAVVFIIAALSDKSFLAVSFDAGGVTTGPMTVPFIMALGAGAASIRSDRNAKADSFGLVALCSIGPILAVLVLGLVYNTDSTTSAIAVNEFSDSVSLGHGYIGALPGQMAEVALALAPIFGFFLLFQVISLKLRKLPFVRIIIGILFTYVGLTLFMTGVNVGFSSLGYVLGNEIASGPAPYMLIPLAILMGWFIINAEPAVHVLNHQVEELSAGAISAKAMGLSLSIAVAGAMGLSMIRVLTGISIMWFMIPGYAVALILALFVPRTFTAIAFDSGGVASGPLTATFMLPFAMGAVTSLGGNVMESAFGLVAMVAMMPLITVQIMGVICVIRKKQAEKHTVQQPDYADNEIIELW